MPHITKWQEKRQCVRPKEELWSEDLKLKYVRPVAEQAVRALAVPQQFYSVLEDLPTRYSDYTTENKRTLFDLIEDIISDTMKSNWTDGNFFNEFVDIKEVPYGRYNSDSDYRGS
jgi:hypothetical protein